MILAVLREQAPGERRVALVPESVSRLVKAGHQVQVESEAGAAAFISDEAYQQAGAEVIASRQQLLAAADTVFSIQPPAAQDFSAIRPGTVVIAIFQPLTLTSTDAGRLAASQSTIFSMDAIPRISRAQSMDVLSSMSTVAGYRAVTMAAEHLGKFFPLLMTAAGTIPPAKVLVLGAGVAGLQAVATAHRLGAVVQAFDTRPVVREQVESLGASFLTITVETEQTQDGYATGLAEDAHARELELLTKPVAAADVVITTALIPGQPAPILITAEMVKLMRPGSVVIDLAGEAGGNCEVSEPGHTVVVDGVIVDAPLNVPSQMPLHASQLYSRNVTTFFTHATTVGLQVQEDPRRAVIEWSDEIVKRTCIFHDGELLHEPTRARLAQERT
ncbi:MAG: Re/Si-specific NAD(P)(+) transhydrogenase subunit alpha [Thermaerobacter sp.]|nr:Re/Si-specific NAD(P)(+) transhydrogenase subunit alpha [Thermaerobacter sp.]